MMGNNEINILPLGKLKKLYMTKSVYFTFGPLTYKLGMYNTSNVAQYHARSTRLNVL